MKYCLKIFRGTPGHQYWESFELPLTPGINIISSLMEIRKNPVNRAGERVAPIVWEDGCLEEVCGSCSMLIDGYPRQACTALVAELLKESGKEEVRLAPFTKFPLVRDLIIDRTSLFDGLKRVRGWIETGGSREEGFGPLVGPARQEILYTLSTCITCGCCSEGCPQVNARSAFIGPAPISQARLFNAHPTGRLQRHERLRPLMEKGGISECGNAQNCVRVCPKKIPLTDSIGAIGRDVTLQAARDLLTFYDRDES